MVNQRIELVSGGRNVDGKFVPNDSPIPSGEIDLNAPITSDSLDQKQGFSTVPVQTPTKSDGLLGFIEGGVDNFTKNLERQATQQQTQADTSFQDYINAQLNTTGQAQATSEAYAQKGGVNDIQAELNDINGQIRQEQRALQNELTALDKNQFGGTREQVEGQKQFLRAESARRQADLYIIQEGIQGRYDSAKAIADRAVDAYTEQAQKKIDALGAVYLRNQGLFDKSEQRAFESAQTDRQNALDAQKENLKAIYDLAIQAQADGAPQAVVQQMLTSKTKEDALALGGGYIGVLDRRLKELQLENIRSQINERNSVTGKKLTTAQSTALGYAERVVQSSLVIDEIGDQFTGLGSIVGQMLPNILKSADRQRYEQAQRNFINAVLRRESGAAIAESEFDSARIQYFPQSGDSPEVLVQKKQNRDLVAKNLLREGGQNTSVQDNSLNDPLELGVSPTNNNPLGI